MRKVFSTVLLSILVSSSVFADEVFDRLMAAKSLKFEFGPGIVADWEGPKVKLEKDNFHATIIYDSIDLKTGKARMIGNAGATDVSVLATGAGLTFVEQTSAGNLIFTTVFAYYAKGTMDFIAVTSRHLDFLIRPLPSQYHGTCKVWE